MQIAPPRRIPPRESVVPMINVVFLLLVFFLMTSQIAPPDPVEIAPPVSDAGAPVDHGTRLFLGADGMPRLDGLRGEAALAALVGRDPADGPIILAADAALPAATAAQVMRRLTELGLTRVELSVVPR